MNDNQEKLDKKFLFKENRKLRIELKQLKQVIKAHKDAINRLTHNNFSENTIISSLVAIIMMQNRKAKEIAQISLELSEMTHKKILLEKILAEIEDEQQENYHLLVEDMKSLEVSKQQLQNQLNKFYQKIGEVDYLSGLVTKYRQLAHPKEEAIAFKKQQDQLIQFISLQKETIQRITEEKNKLIKINILMKDQIQKKKDDIKNMTVFLSSPDAFSLLNSSNLNNNNGDYQACQNILDELEQVENESSAQQEKSTCQQKQILQEEQKKQKNFNSIERKQNLNPNISMLNYSLNNSLLNTSTAKNLNTTLNFIKLQREIIKQKQEDELNSSMEAIDSEQFDCPELNILFPDKVEQIKKNRQTARVPYLNMKKIRELMARRENKIRRGVEADSKHINPTQKIIKLESQLEITRKELTNQSLKFRMMEEKFKKIVKQIQELQNRNNILIRANEKYMHGYKNIYRECVWGRRVWSILSKALKLRLGSEFTGKIQLDGKKNLQFQQMDNQQQKILFLKDLSQKIMEIQPSQYILQLQRQREQDQLKILELNQILNALFYGKDRKRLNEGNKKRSDSVNL